MEVDLSLKHKIQNTTKKYKIQQKNTTKKYNLIKHINNFNIKFI
jgi:hypothetical protein